MKVNKSTVEKWTLTELDNMDPINIFMEEGYHKLYDSNWGKMTIEVFGKSWTAFWGAMGCPLKEFFLRTNNDYVISKFNHAHRPEPEIDATDEEDIQKGLQKVIIQQRRENLLTESEAREAWDSLDSVYCIDSFMNRSELDCLGDERWDLFPKVENREYTYACKVLDYIREAIKQARATLEGE